MGLVQPVKLIAFVLLIIGALVNVGWSSAKAENSNEDFVLAAVGQIWAKWSEANDPALDYLSRVYDRSVVYYGKPEPHRRVMKLKREYAERWPSRHYSVSPGSLEVTCVRPGNSCKVSGRVYWDARSEERGVRAVGSANFELGVLRNGNSFQVISETGHVLSNKSASLSDDSELDRIPVPSALVPSVGTPGTTVLKTAQIAKVVIYCFNAGKGRLTIQEMYDCSGVWVTPRALLRCSLGTQCPVSADTVIGRATFKRILEAEKLKLTDVLQLRAGDVPPIPSKALVDACRATSANENELERCVVEKGSPENLVNLQKCLREKQGVEQAKCLAAPINDAALADMTACLNGRRPTPDAVLACMKSDDASAKAAKIRSCVEAASDASKAAACIGESLPGNQKVAVECLTNLRGNRDPTICLSSISPNLPKASGVVKCLNTDSTASNVDKVACVTTLLPGDSGKVAKCLNDPDEAKAAQCILGDTAEARTAVQLYRCVSTGKDAASLIENCTTNLGLDPNTQQTLACAARSNGDQDKLVGCAAQAVLPPEAARYVGCAASSQGATSFALCAAGPKMNEEWRIAAECAVNSAGQPYATAVCAATRLTFRELGKCFKGDCFGKNNTIVVALNTVYNDLIHGLGPNNDIRKAVDAIGDAIDHAAKETQKFFEKPLGGDNALIPKARDDVLDTLGIGGTGRKIIQNPTQFWTWF